MVPFIFYTGAPGSRWSAVGKVICQLPIIDNSDHSAKRNYQHHRFAGHFGNYFGPGMEFGHNFAQLDQLSRPEIAAELNRPYGNGNPDGFRLVKSHVFALHLDHIHRLFPECGIMAVWRDRKTCLDWWLHLGGFSIPYPDYSWYRDEKTMAERIQKENQGIERFIKQHNLELEPMTPAWMEKIFGMAPDFPEEDYFADVYVAANFTLDKNHNLISH